MYMRSIAFKRTLKTEYFKESEEMCMYARRLRRTEAFPVQGKVVPQEPDEVSIHFSLLERYRVLRTDQINNSSVTSGDSFPKCPVGIHRAAFSSVGPMRFPSPLSS